MSRDGLEWNCEKAASTDNNLRVSQSKEHTKENSQSHQQSAASQPAKIQKPDQSMTVLLKTYPPRNTKHIPSTSVILLRSGFSCGHCAESPVLPNDSGVC